MRRKSKTAGRKRKRQMCWEDKQRGEKLTGNNRKGRRVGEERTESRSESAGRETERIRYLVEAEDVSLMEEEQRKD